MPFDDFDVNNDELVEQTETMLGEEESGYNEGEEEGEFFESDEEDPGVGKVFVVTGGNRGIGFEIVKRLAMLKKPEDVVYLCSRSVYRGEDAEEELEKEGLRVSYLQLDIEDVESIDWLATTLSRRHGAIDVLINNAGVSYAATSDVEEKSITEQAEHTIDVNYFGTLNVCQRLFPLLGKHGRVVNVSSQAGHMALSRMSRDLRERFLSRQLTVDQLGSLMREFLDVVRAQDGDSRGWPGTFYGVSKLGVTLLSSLQQKEFDRTPRNDILVNAVCPGFCATRLCNQRGPRSASDGADVAVYAGLLLPRRFSNPRGRFLVDDDPVSLESPDLPVFKQKRAKTPPKADAEFSTR